MASTQCNICFKYNNKLVPLKELCEDNLSIFQKLQFVAPYQEWLDWHLICDICISLLETSYQFIKLCSKYKPERMKLVHIDREDNSQSTEVYNSPCTSNISDKKDNNEDPLKTAIPICSKYEPEQMKLVHIDREDNSKDTEIYNRPCTSNISDKNVNDEDPLKTAIPICSKDEPERMKFVHIDREDNSQNTEVHNSPCTSNISVKNDNDEDPPKTATPIKEQMEILTIEIEQAIGSSLKNFSRLKEASDNEKDSLRNTEIDSQLPNDNIVRNFHSENIDNKCFKCNKMFPNTHELGIHISNYHSYKCKLCDKGYRTKGSLGQHVRLEHPMKTSCETCGNIFWKAKDLRQHCIVKHSQKTNEVKPFQCHICDKRFKSRSSFNRHIQYHEGLRNYICKVCGKTFITKKDVDMHELIHENKKNYRCHSCPKRFNTRANLGMHMRCVHSDPKGQKFECYICSKKYSLKSNLKVHIKRHIGLKDHPCKICKATFTCNSDLKKHYYTHAKDKPYKCEFCEDKSFREWETLRTHFEKIHFVFCEDKSFRESQDLRTQLEKGHGSIVQPKN